ncbi:hypothetical protein [Streptomyces sp. NPDC059010]|uniref:hypothetical protein n=1 Tax=Streptomyces sp. NPDC059010 TaxID=3346695 RepID=UPI00367F1E7E
MDGSSFAPFGERAAALLDKWQQQNHRKLGNPTFLETGGSGALLASVTVRDGDPDKPRRRMIIKLCAPDQEASVEPGGLKAAWLSRPSGNESFPEQHLVEQLYDPMPVGDDTWMMFQQIAGDRRDMITLGAVVREWQARLPDIAAAVARSLLTDWNPDEKGSESLSVVEFVTAMLGRRLAPEAPLAVWARDELGISFSDAWISLPGDPGVALPNPLHLTARSPLSRGTVDDPARGRAHGDLHPGNIMVPASPDAEAGSYRLVDLTRFAKDAFLARDPVHLMLCLVAEFLPHMSEAAREEALALLLGRETPGLLLPQGLQRIVQDMSEAPAPWLDARETHPGWEIQWTLALQACALMFCARRSHDSRDRRWFFRLAAEAAAVSVRRFGAYEPEAVVAVRAPSETAGRPVGASVEARREAVAVGVVPLPRPGPVWDSEPMEAFLGEVRETLAFHAHRLRTRSSASVRWDEVHVIANRANAAYSALDKAVDEAFDRIPRTSRGPLLDVLEALTKVCTLAVQFDGEAVQHTELMNALNELFERLREARVALR